MPRHRPEDEVVNEQRHGIETVVRQRLSRLLPLVAQDVKTVVDRELAIFGLTTQQAQVLGWLYGHGAEAPTRLAPAIGTDPPGMTRLIDRLESKGLVRRTVSPSDGRARRIELTARGRGLAPRIVQTAESLQREIFGVLSATEAETLKVALLQIREAAKATATQQVARANQGRMR
jgi:DNA-binding MarR family transcriptional regulator